MKGGATPKQYLVRGDGSPVPSSWRTEFWTDRVPVDTLTSSESLANLVMPRFEQTVLGHLTDRSEDLVRIACTIFIADQLVSRGGVRDVHDAAWSRRFGLCLGVRDIEFWSQPEVQTRLAAMIRYATDDHWRFHFSPLHERSAGQITLIPPIGARVLHSPPGCVVLFSGGIDSLATVARAAANGERPLAISHWGEGGTKERQRRLLDALRGWPEYQAVLQAWSFPWVPLNVHGTMADPPERTRRSRAVLFACLGAMVAGELGVERVYLADNGPISLNLPVNDQIIGAHASRSTHPKFLERVNDLMALVYDTPMRLSNPLWNRTRAETITILKDLELEELLRDTLSCANWRARPARTPQCGYCSQCIDRRIAMVVSDTERYEPGSGYQHDVFQHKAPTDDGALMAMSYVRFAQAVAEMDDLQILAAYPQLLEAACHPDLSPDQVIPELLQLVKRHAHMVLDGRERLERRGEQERRAGQQDPFSVLTLSSSSASLWVLDEDPAFNEVPQESAALTAPERIFARDGDGWTVTFAGRTERLDHHVGLTRIAYLLAHPAQSFKPGALFDRTRETPVDPLPQITVREASDEGLAGEGRGSVSEKAPWDDLMGVDAVIAALEDERESAAREGWQFRVDEIDRELATLYAQQDELGPTSSVLARPGHERDSYARVRDTVYQSIRRLLPTIAMRHPALHAHLLKTLRFGAHNEYQPVDEVPWITVLTSEEL
jgi:7-cyano-7-deazaguanine synthase in queuosine biosynthesis